MQPRTYATGAEPSTIDLRDFKFAADKGPVAPSIKGGERYKPENIEDQHAVGICTAISLTQNARKALGIKFSAEFQYLLQKKYFDKNWNEGSSARASLHVAYTYGLLPAEHWTLTTEADRKLPYSQYIQKLKAIPQSEIDRLLKIAGSYKLAGYAAVPVKRDSLAAAVNESRSGLIVRFVVGREWWRAPIEPLRKVQTPISGHLIVYSNYDGNSYRLANMWGTDWADLGTAYGSLITNPPTEAWIPYYNDLPPKILEQKLTKEQLQGQLIALIQRMISALKLKKG